MNNNSYITIAVIGAALGIKGWVKVHSHTSPADNILNYQQLWLGNNKGEWQEVKVAASKAHGKGHALKLEHCNDRNQAETLRHCVLAIEKDSLPPLEVGEYYWHQLQGLQVINQSRQVFGVVSHLIETGSNDVLVVKANADSIDNRERLLPYRPEFIVAIDLDLQQIRVDWDADF